jgi:hypothetical protein
VSVAKPLDAVDRHARLWRAEDRILARARRLSAAYDLDAEYVERMESACLHGDSGAFERALGELLDEIAASLD